MSDAGVTKHGLLFRLGWRISTALSAIGERQGWDALTYNPWQMWGYHRLAVRDAPAVASALTEAFPDAERFIDVGAGSGAFAAALQRSGKQVIAAERSCAGRAIARLQGVTAIPLELGVATRTTVTERYDVAYCFEVAEHLLPAIGDTLVSYLTELAPIVVFTAARPGQGGLGHVNEQPPDYWRGRFASHCFAPSIKEDELRALYRRSGVCASWLVDNTMVFAE